MPPRIESRPTDTKMTLDKGLNVNSYDWHSFLEEEQQLDQLLSEPLKNHSAILTFLGKLLEELEVQKISSSRRDFIIECLEKTRTVYPELITSIITGQFSQIINQ